MENNLYFSPRRDLAAGAEAIILERASGERIALDPASKRVEVTTERPRVDMAEEDLGALCEDFLSRASYTAEVNDVVLAKGDRVMIRYPARSQQTLLTVIEVVDGMAWVEMEQVSG